MPDKVALGIRCEPGAVHHVVLSGNRQKYSIVEARSAKVPVGMSRASGLAWLRRELHETLTRCSPEVGAFKAAEATAGTGKGARERLEFEAVVQEAAITHDVGVELERLTWTPAAKRMRFSGKPKDLLEYLDESALGALRPKPLREAAIVAVALLEA